MKTAFPIALIFLFISCSSENDNDDDPYLPAIPTAEEVAKVNLDPGTRNDEMLLMDGSTWPFHISVGNIEDGEKVPLVVGLHWMGDAETAYKEYSQCLFDNGFRSINGIKIALSAEGGGWGENVVYKFVELAIEHWPIDPERVAVTGYSNGGTSAWNFAHNNNSPFTASIPMAGLYSFFGTSSMPFYVIHGTNDDLFLFNQSKATVEDAIASGSEGQFVEAEGLGHFEACSYLTYLKESAKWLEDKAWK